MRILSVKFSTSPKVYQYLERNQNKIRINYCEPLKIPQAFYGKNIDYKTIRVVNVEDVDKIPSHVTSFIEPVDGNNIIKVGKIIDVPEGQLSFLEIKDKNTYKEPKLLPTIGPKNIDDIFTNEKLVLSQNNKEHIFICGYESIPRKKFLKTMELRRKYEKRFVRNC